MLEPWDYLSLDSLQTFAMKCSLMIFGLVPRRGFDVNLAL